MKKTLILTILLAVTAYIVMGCECPLCPKKAPPKPVAKATPKPAPAPKPIVKEGTCGACTLSNHYPGCNVIRLTKMMPCQVMANKSFDYQIEVTNTSEIMLSNVTVTDNIPKNYKFSSAVPTAQADAGKLVWVIEKLDPKETVKITVTGIATEAGCVKTCAKVTYDILTCASANATQPSLKLVKEAPAEVLLCDNIPLKFTVTNNGTGVTSNVVIKDTLPEGWMTSDGKTSISIPAGNLDAGQSKTASVMVKARKTGTYTNKAMASADGDLTSESGETKTIVRQPVLAITKTAPEKTILGRDITFEITVTNKGDTQATNTVIRDIIPAGATFVKASDGGTATAGNVVWNVGNLAPNASKKVMITYKPTGTSQVANKATASATCAEDVTAMAKTNVVGVPGILLQVEDLVDPVMVGDNVTYVITSTNQGFAPLTNLIIKAKLDGSHKYVSSKGATTGTLSGDTITFAPLATLAPKAKATWEIVVKVTEPGDHLLTVTAKSNELRETQETESSNSYE